LRKNCFVFILLMVMVMSMGSVSYAYREVARGSFMSAKTESITVFESKEDLLATFAALHIFNFEAIESLDFSKEIPVFIVASACPDSGYRIVAEIIDFRNGEVNVKYKTERGPEGMMYAQVISYPWLLAAVEKQP